MADFDTKLNNVLPFPSPGELTARRGNIISTNASVDIGEVRQQNAPNAGKVLGQNKVDFESVSEIFNRSKINAGAVGDAIQKMFAGNTKGVAIVENVPNADGTKGSFRVQIQPMPGNLKGSFLDAVPLGPGIGFTAYYNPTRDGGLATTSKTVRKFDVQGDGQITSTTLYTYAPENVKAKVPSGNLLN